MTDPLEDPQTDATTAPREPRRPRLIVFDVNETLSDMGPMAERFVSVGAPAHLAATWFAGLLRDGFALTITGDNPSFAELASQSLRPALAGLVPDLDSAVRHIMEGFASLPVHPDIVEGVRDLHDMGITLVTLSNGAAAIAQGLIERNGLRPYIDRVLSVEDAPQWKPAATAYGYAVQACGVAAAEAMLVAVHPWDIHGAHRAGLSTGWLNRGGVGYPSFFERPDVEAPSLPDLARRLADY